MFITPSTHSRNLLTDGKVHGTPGSARLLQLSHSGKVKFEFCPEWVIICVTGTTRALHHQWSCFLAFQPCVCGVKGLDMLQSSECLRRLHHRLCRYSPPTILTCGAWWTAATPPWGATWSASIVSLYHQHVKQPRRHCEAPAECVWWLTYFLSVLFS